MSSDAERSDHFADLRERAEELLALNPPLTLDAVRDLRELMHELDVHQVELEMQNNELRWAQEALATTQRDYKELYDFAPFGYLTLDPKGIVTRANLGACSLMRATRTEILQSSVSSFLESSSREPYIMARKRARESDTMVTVELQLGGRYDPGAWVQAILHRDCDTHGNVTQIRLAFLDISARKLAGADAQAMRNKLGAALASMSDGIFISDAQGEAVHMNAAWRAFHRCARDADCGICMERKFGSLEVMLPNGFRAPASRRPIARALRGETALNQEYHFKRCETGESWIGSYNLAPIYDDDGAIDGAVVTARDITTMREHERALDRAAHHDPLTGLPNRLLLGDRLEQAIAMADRTGNSLAVCYLDLDDFKPLNDEHGHDTGDRFLKSIASILRQILRAHDSVARIGGDEFVLLLCEVHTQQDVSTLLTRLLAQLRRPVGVAGTEHQLSASIGVTLYPGDQVDADGLLRHADQALYRAKALGGNRYQFFDTNSERSTQQRRAFNGELVAAVEREEFVLYYQPQIDLVSRALIGAEALIRWQRPDQGLIAPAEFLPDIEGSDLELAVGDWVISSALRQLSQWNQRGLRLRVGINVGVGQLIAPDFVTGLSRQLQEHGDVDPAQVEIEILESVAVEDFEETHDIIDQCRSLGVRFALDDFGTGYASLAYFRELPVDRLKIDQVFVRDMRNDKGDVQIVESVVKLAQAFDREVIAEGVETIEHTALLTWLGCRLGQGYGIARPMPAEDFPNWAERWAKQPTWPAIDESRSRADIALMAAAQDHLHWFDKVVGAVETGNRVGVQRTDSQTCAFSRWLRSRGEVHFGQSPEYPDIVDAHASIHALAQELLELAEAGEAHEAQARLPALHTMRDQFVSMLAALVQ